MRCGAPVPRANSKATRNLDREKGVERVEDPSRGAGAAPLPGPGQSPGLQRHAGLEDGQVMEAIALGAELLAAGNGQDIVHQHLAQLG